MIAWASSKAISAGGLTVNVTARCCSTRRIDCEASASDEMDQFAQRHESSAGRSPSLTASGTSASWSGVSLDSRIADHHQVDVVAFEVEVADDRPVDQRPGGHRQRLDVQPQFLGADLVDDDLPLGPGLVEGHRIAADGELRERRPSSFFCRCAALLLSRVMSVPTTSTSTEFDPPALRPKIDRCEAYAVAAGDLIHGPGRESP